MIPMPVELCLLGRRSFQGMSQEDAIEWMYINSSIYVVIQGRRAIIITHPRY
jgi:hypothetical protein